MTGRGAWLAPVGAAVLALASTGGVCGGGNVPTSDTCTLPAGYVAPQLTSLEVGQVGADGQFRPFTDRAVVPLVVGGQGADMIIANLRLRGSGIGGCLEQRTLLEVPGGELIASEGAPLRTRADGAGGFVTGDAFLVYYAAPGALVRVRAEVAGQAAMVDVWADTMQPYDAPPPDGPGTDAP